MIHWNKVTYWLQPDGTRRYTTYCCCPKCWKDGEIPNDQQNQATTTDVDPAARYEYHGNVLDATDTAKAMSGLGDVLWGLWAGEEIFWLEMICALRVGDWFTTDEPWADKDRCTRVNDYAACSGYLYALKQAYDSVQTKPDAQQNKTDPKENKMSELSIRCWNQSQSWHYEATYKIDNHKLRIAIRRNAYDEQSFARVSRWDGTQWHQVCSKPITECHCKTISYVRADVTTKDFEQDKSELLQEAMAIIAS